MLDKGENVNEKMNPEVKSLWVAALRSGDYSQGRGALAKESVGEISYCCLGVLCELAFKKGLVTRSSSGFNTVTFNGEAALLPDALAKWSGVSREGSYGNGPHWLTEDNDEKRLSFNELADLIEEHF